MVRRLRPAIEAVGLRRCGQNSWQDWWEWQELCPQRLNPTASIAGLKRRTMWVYLKGEI